MPEPRRRPPHAIACSWPPASVNLCVAEVRPAAALDDRLPFRGRPSRNVRTHRPTGRPSSPAGPWPTPPSSGGPPRLGRSLIVPSWPRCRGRSPRHLAAGVRVHQAPEPAGGQPADARRQQVQQAVEHLDLGGVARVPLPSVTVRTKPNVLAVGPPVPQRQAQRGVDLLETTRFQDALVQVPLDARGRMGSVNGSQRTGRLAAGDPDTQQGDRPGEAGNRCNSSSVVVGEEGLVLSTRPAVGPPVLETNIQWSESLTMLIRNGGIRSTSGMPYISRPSSSTNPSAPSPAALAGALRAAAARNFFLTAIVLSQLSVAPSLLARASMVLRQGRFINCFRLPLANPSGEACLAPTDSAPTRFWHTVCDPQAPAQAPEFLANNLHTLWHPLRAGCYDVLEDEEVSGHCLVRRRERAERRSERREDVRDAEWHAERQRCHSQTVEGVQDGLAVELAGDARVGPCREPEVRVRCASTDGDAACRTGGEVGQREDVRGIRDREVGHCSAMAARSAASLSALPVPMRLRVVSPAPFTFRMSVSPSRVPPPP